MESVLRPCRLWSKFQPCQHNTLGIIKIQKFVKFQFFIDFFKKIKKRTQTAEDDDGFL